LQYAFYGFYGNIFGGIKQHNFHSGPVLLNQKRFIEILTFYNSNIRLIQFFVDPQIAKHFTLVTKKGQSILPIRGDIAVLL
jgi:hypothetical protein